MLNKKYLTKENIILFFIPVILAVYMRFGMADYFSFYFHNFFFNPVKLHIARVFYEYVFVFLTQAVLPIVLIVFVFKESLTKYGFQFGDLQFGFKIVFLSLLPIAVVLILTALLPDTVPPLFHSVYPAIPEVKSSLFLFIVNCFFLLLYYAGFEIFYRGFILFGLKDRFGISAAVLIQAIPSVLIHIHKPNGELFASILAEIVFGILAVKTQSIYYGFFIHYFIGVGIELATILF